MRKETPVEDKRTARIAIQMTESEKSEIFTAARAAGYDASAFMRSVALERARAK